MNNSQYSKRLHKNIPGGAHTYSRGDDQYPTNAPAILERGEGAYVYDCEGNKFLDFGMALRAINIGYAEERVNSAAIKYINYGNNLTRASKIELEAAELFNELIPSSDMVKFTKNGSSAVSAAVKLSRAYTGRDLIARCSHHPFFSYDDWFIGSTLLTKGIPLQTQQQTKMFGYNDIQSLEKLFEEYPNQIACVVLEPATLTHPNQSETNANQNFLHDVQRICKKNGSVFILDEMITGFRWHLQGAQKYYDIEPDLCTFGKAMANGFSVAALGGKAEIMKLGSIDEAGTERVFLLSTTHGAEMSSLGAFVETISFLKENNVIENNWNTGRKVVSLINEISSSMGMKDYFYAEGIEVSPSYVTKNPEGEVSLDYRTLLSQELIKNGVLMPWISICFRHQEEELKLLGNALERSLSVYKKAINDGLSNYLHSPSIKPVFRKYN